MNNAASSLAHIRGCTVVENKHILPIYKHAMRVLRGSHYADQLHLSQNNPSFHHPLISTLPLLLEKIADQLSIPEPVKQRAIHSSWIITAISRSGTGYILWWSSCRVGAPAYTVYSRVVIRQCSLSYQQTNSWVRWIQTIM